VSLKVEMSMKIIYLVLFINAVKNIKENIVIDNNILKVEISSDGRLVSVYDYHADRDLRVDNQPMNVFQFYEDIPLYFDAWDVVYPDLG
jgi:alpha-mannosidase